eukprot:Blabericola_migrator_1__4098@NODE_224_length_11141_cov_42_071880_g190_i0_p7_GENE_NODE_224_length_11141_cov_42_071880_g190_i0NODE_224_length_11141_cov_42_071880_g190_i0_p7_ORF_typecomplete_len214_score29_53SNARE/PF05739_19/0_14_NODE_224_length_11141_cov_42_071880_g190_i050065647
MNSKWVLAFIAGLCQGKVESIPSSYDDARTQVESVVWSGPALDLHSSLEPDLRSGFEQALYANPSIPQAMADFLRTFVPTDLTRNLDLQEVSQMMTQLERANYELARGVEDIKRARKLKEIKLIVLGSIHLQRDNMMALCNRWTEGRRVCRYITGLTSYFLWVHFCGSLQYPPLINEICHDWPVHLFSEVYTYDKQKGSPDDVSAYFSNMMAI